MLVREFSSAIELEVVALTAFEWLGDSRNLTSMLQCRTSAMSSCA